ncbi:MAG: glycoside hydrolase family 3 protein [Acidobacteria bacterium]|nr:glycoside hydrolase family 3 protein [Acidobacteriota bacterium]
MLNSLPLVVGIPGLEITEAERTTLDRISPAGIILFARNVESPEQVRELVLSVRDMDPRPFICVDLEGGAVNRLTALWGDLPSPSEAAFSGMKGVQALGDAAGAACRALGIHLDLAPVIDLERPDGLIARQGRSLSTSAERSATLARAFSEKMGAWAVSGCIKHFPGLGAIKIDTHEDLPTLDHRIEDLDEHLGVFAALSSEIPIVMVGHVVAPVLGENEKPASLSRHVVQLALDLPGRPVVLSDDLEMGALEGFGDLPELVSAALRARNHGVLVCQAFDRLEEIADYLRHEAEADTTFAGILDEGRSRLGTLARDLCRQAAAVPAPDDATVAQLWEKARKAAFPGSARDQADR